MTTYHIAMCADCDSLDVADVSECDHCDRPVCAECMTDDDLCESCADTAFMDAVDAVGAEPWPGAYAASQRQAACDSCCEMFRASHMEDGLCGPCAKYKAALSAAIDDLATHIPRRYLFGHA